MIVRWLITQNPMDLGTVQKKLAADRYVDLVDFMEDVRLVSACYAHQAMAVCLLS